MDAPSWDSRESRATHATSKPKGTTNCTTKTTGDPSASTKTCRSVEVTTSSSYGDPLAPTKTVEAPASKTSSKSSIPSGSTAVSTLGCRTQAEAGAAGIWDEGRSSTEASFALVPCSALARHGS